MSEQLVFDVQDTPRARQSDPETSWEAARSIKAEAISEMKERILKLLEVPGKDEELIARFEMCQFPGSPSGIRSRRSELEKSGQVKRVGTSRTASGCKCGVFQVVK